MLPSQKRWREHKFAETYLFRSYNICKFTIFRFLGTNPHNALVYLGFYDLCFGTYDFNELRTMLKSEFGT